MKKRKHLIKTKWALPVVGIFFVVALCSIYFFSNGEFVSFDLTPLPHNPSNHVKQPEIVKAIYLTAWSASTKRFDELLELVKNTELNAMVIDIKTGSGEIAFEPKNPNFTKYSSINVIIEDLDGIVEKAHEAGVYLIARNFVFQDPAVVKKHPEWAVQNKYGGVWKDWKGVTWVDPAVRGVWDYNVELSKEIYERGFDEINFDYIRFPSDGPMANIEYNFFDGVDRSETMKEFYAYLDEKLRQKKIPISADLFGLTCCNEGDMSIGQKVIDAYQ
ncbi:MAG: putative glycoside hydrolase, partial [Patescibacteria group bacterium]|nr:putative glycoside hydrolase [Patescibacteria group bacterium]